MHHPRLLFTSCLLSLLLCGNLFAQWPDDPAQNLLICDRTGEQTIPKVAATPDGGCYVGWYDNSSGNYDMYLQRLDASGTIIWETNGLLVSDHPQESWLTDWDMTADLTNHCILVFNDIRAGGDWDMYAYRISPDGAFMWGPDGIALSANDYFEAEPRVVVTDSNNCVFTWIETPAEGSTVRVRKLSPEGDDLFDPATISFTSEWGVTLPRLAAKTGDEVYLQYLVQQGQQIWSPRHIHLQRLGATGELIWNDATIISIAGGLGPQMRPDIISNGSDDVYSFWYDSRDNILRVYAQHTLSDGTVQWTENGTRIDSASTENLLSMNPTGVVAPNGNLILFFVTANASQSLWGIGVWPGYAPEAIEPLAPEQPSYLHALRQGDNVSIVYKRDASGGTGNTFVHAASLNPDGQSPWDEEIVDLCTVASDKGHLAADVTSNEQLLAAWPDSRIENGDIYLQNVNPDGTLGPYDSQPWIEIISPAQDTTVNSSTLIVVCDIGNFELGTDGLARITGWWANEPVTVEVEGDTNVFSLPFTELGLWAVVATLHSSPEDPPIPGANDTVYVTYVVPSLTITSPVDSTYVNSGESIDIVFEAEHFDIAESGGDGYVHVYGWLTPPIVEPHLYIEFDHFTSEPVVYPFGPGDAIGDHEVSLTLVDYQGIPIVPLATDTVHIGYGEIAADDPPGIPDRFALHPAYPNPFNPETTLQFDVKQTAQVRITAYDVLGRAAATLVNDTYDAGRHSITWDASDLSSGVYFVRMQAGEFVATQKLMLIR